MKLHIRGKGLTITPALSQYIERKIGHLATWFPSELRETGEAKALLSLEGRERLHKAEIVLAIGGMTARGELETKDMYGSIDGVAEKLERQIRRHKTKLGRARCTGRQRKAAAL
ncbi:ribosome hibernation-promoting factor, HPF/YfiA family [Paenibacillus thermotolerans]|uniref:ribosome hibernation-promoting factor, HPF/YfiA family n=1 Tax=Paenibacillus thermotolerans TaxID=3027807 RepID=UPI002368E9E4|nr:MULTISPECIES: ribosome-associated translation inhibitor RaiA [unclassified Paenibacillus]